MQEDLNKSTEDQDLDLLNKLEKANKLLAEDHRALQTLQGSNNGKTGGLELGHSRQNSISSLLSILSNTSSTVANNYANDENGVESLWSMWGNLISDWDNSVKKKTTTIRDLTRKGVPQHFRGLVWQHLSGARDFEDKHRYSELLAECSPFEKTIRRDITRTFPDHHLFKVKNGDGQESLFNVMKAYSLYDREVGYCQGSCFIVGLLLMHMPEEDAFCVLVRIMGSKYNMRELYKPAMAELGLKMFQLDCMIQDILPDLYNHMQTQSVSTSMFASSWFLTIYATVLPLSVASRVMDIFLSEGVEVIFRIGITLLQLSLGEILSLDMEETIQYLQKDLASKVDNDGENLIAQALLVKYNARKMKRLEKEYLIIKAKEQEEQVELRRLRAENKLLTQRIENLEKETEALADRLVQSQVQLAQREEDLLILKQKRSQPINYVLPQLQNKPTLPAAADGSKKNVRSPSQLGRATPDYAGNRGNDYVGNRVTPDSSRSVISSSLTDSASNYYEPPHRTGSDCAGNRGNDYAGNRGNGDKEAGDISFDDLDGSFSSVDYDSRSLNGSGNSALSGNSKAGVSGKNDALCNLTINPLTEAARPDNGASRNNDNCPDRKTQKVAGAVLPDCAISGMVNNSVNKTSLVLTVNPLIRPDNVDLRDVSADVKSVGEENYVSQEEITCLQNELIICKLSDAEANMVVKQLQCRLREIEKQWQKTCRSEPGIAAKELAILGRQLKEANMAAEIGDLRMRLAHAEQECYAASTRDRCRNEENARLRDEIKLLGEQNRSLRNKLNENNLQKLETHLSAVNENCCEDFVSTADHLPPSTLKKIPADHVLKPPAKKKITKTAAELARPAGGHKFEWLKFSATV